MFTASGGFGLFFLLIFIIRQTLYRLVVNQHLIWRDIFYPELPHACQRECDDGPARRCIYDFHVEYYFTMSKACFDCPHTAEDCDKHHCIPADGVERGVVVINRQLPGPSIQVNDKYLEEFLPNETWIETLALDRFVRAIGLWLMSKTTYQERAAPSTGMEFTRYFTY